METLRTVGAILLTVITAIFVVMGMNQFIDMVMTSSTSPPEEVKVENCLDVYSGGKLIWQGKAERDRFASSDGAVGFTNKITNQDMLIRSDFIYYVCKEN